MVALQRAAHSHSGCLNDGLLCLRLGILVESNLSLDNRTLLDNDAWLDDWVHLSLNYAFAKMVKNDFTQLNSLGSTPVVEIELDSLRVAVNLGELDDVPSSETELQLSVSNLSPAPFEHMKHVDVHL